MDLVRQILLAVEAIPAGEDALQLEIPGIDPEIYWEHARLMAEAGLIEVNILGGAGYVIVRRLTWDGHEFIDAARNDTLWKKFKDKLRDGFSSVPFVVASKLLSEFAVAHARSLLNLPPG